MSLPNKRITQQELESYLWGAAVLLRGLIDAGDYKQFIFPLLFYKRVSDVWDEEYRSALADSDGDLSYAQFAENHRFQIPEGAHWNDVRLTLPLESVSHSWTTRWLAEVGRRASFLRTASG